MLAPASACSASTSRVLARIPVQARRLFAAATAAQLSCWSLPPRIHPPPAAPGCVRCVVRLALPAACFALAVAFLFFCAAARCFLLYGCAFR